MDIREVRRHNLKKLMDDKFGLGARGAQSRLAEMLGKPQNLLSRYLAPPEKSGSKTIGEDFAREVEAAFELPRYGLDHPLSSTGGGGFETNVEQGPPIISPTRRIEIVGTAQLGNDGYWVGLDIAEGWQITDTGITPGSGVGNSRSAINKDVLGVPVVAIGVPTVVDIRSLLADMGDAKLSEETANSNDMIVTPRNIDSEVACASRIVAYAINLALHKGLTVEDVDMLVG